MFVDFTKENGEPISVQVEAIASVAPLMRGGVELGAIITTKVGFIHVKETYEEVMDVIDQNENCNR